MIVPFEAGGLRYEFEEDTWRRIYAGEWDDERTPPMPVLREIIRGLQARLIGKQALIDEYARRLVDVERKLSQPDKKAK